MTRTHQEYQQLDIFTPVETPVQAKPAVPELTPYRLADPELDAVWQAERQQNAALALATLQHNNQLLNDAPSQAEQIANARRTEKENPSHRQVLDRD